jgi:hypothetical protein
LDLVKKGNSDDFRLPHIHQNGGGDMVVKITQITFLLLQIQSDTVI